MQNKSTLGNVASYLSKEESCSDLPKETDTVIIGGGLVGAALSYYLSNQGVEVLLAERNEINREASGTNAGSFHFQIALHQLTSSKSSSEEARLLTEVRLQLSAAKSWDTLENELGMDLGVHFTGGLMVAETAEELQVLRDKQRIEKLAGLETEVFTGSRMRDFAPYLAPDLSGIAFCAREGHANPLLVGPAFVQRSSNNGAKIRTKCEVTKVEINENSISKRFKVCTNRGVIFSRRIINASGAWTTDISHSLGLNLPMASIGLHVNVTEPREYFLKPMIQHIGRRLTLKQTENNTFIIGGGWPSRPEVFPKRFSNYWDSAAGNAAVAIRVLPMLKDVRLVRVWSGVWSYTTDFKPILGESKKVPGYHVAMVPTGFTLGPLVAKMLAEYIVTDGKSNLIPKEFNVDR